MIQRMSAEIVLHAGEDDEGCNSEKVAGLVAIRVWAEVARVMPEGQRAMGKVQEKAKRRERPYSAGNNARGDADIAQVGIERHDVINPGDAGDEREQTIKRQPRLGSKSGRELHPEIIR